MITPFCSAVMALFNLPFLHLLITNVCPHKMGLSGVSAAAEVEASFRCCGPFAVVNPDNNVYTPRIKMLKEFNQH